MAPRASPSKYTLLIALLGLSTLLAAAFSITTLRSETTVSRQDIVFEKGKRVMPFDQNQTTHIFTNLENGGTQQVVAKDPRDTKNIKLIREHLQLEAKQFQAGDLSDPAAIHGQDMPGLVALNQAVKDKTLLITYQDLPNGGLLTYIAANKSTRSALYTWFDAQKSDHGVHAR